MATAWQPLASGQTLSYDMANPRTVNLAYSAQELAFMNDFINRVKYNPNDINALSGDEVAKFNWLTGANINKAYQPSNLDASALSELPGSINDYLVGRWSGTLPNGSPIATTSNGNYSYAPFSDWYSGLANTQANLSGTNNAPAPTPTPTYTANQWGYYTPTSSPPQSSTGDSFVSLGDQQTYLDPEFAPGGAWHTSSPSGNQSVNSGFPTMSEDGLRQSIYGQLDWLLKNQPRPSYYQGQTYAGLTQDQTTAQRLAREFANSIPGFMNDFSSGMSNLASAPANASDIQTQAQQLTSQFTPFDIRQFAAGNPNIGARAFSPNIQAQSVPTSFNAGVADSNFYTREVDPRINGGSVNPFINSGNVGSNVSTNFSLNPITAGVRDAYSPQVNNIFSSGNLDPNVIRNQFGLGGISTDPSGALNRMMTGEVSPQFGDITQSQLGQAQRAYSDMTRSAMEDYQRQILPQVQAAQALPQQAARQFLEQIAPEIRSSAQFAGQYGGSRQGIAEGLAASRIGEELTRQMGNIAQTADLGAGSLAGQFARQAGQVGESFGQVAAQNAAQAYESAQNRALGATNTASQFGLGSQGINVDLARLGLSADTARAGILQDNLTRSLQAQGMSADVAAQNAARMLQAQGMNQGADVSNADIMARNNQLGLQAAQLGQQGEMFNVDTQFKNIANSLQAQGMSADIAAQNAARQLQAQGMSADIATQNANRYIQTQGMSSDVQTQNLARALQAQGMRADVAAQNAARMLQAEGMNYSIMQADDDRNVQAQIASEQAYQNRYRMGLDAMNNANNLNLSYQQQAAQNMMNSLGFAPQYLQMGGMGSDIYGAIGAQNQQINQQAINDAMNRYYYNANAPFMNVEQIASMFGMTPRQQIVPEMPTQNMNPWLTGAGLGISALGAGLGGPAALGVGALGYLAANNFRL